MFVTRGVTTGHECFVPCVHERKQEARAFQLLQRPDLQCAWLLLLLLLYCAAPLSQHLLRSVQPAHVAVSARAYDDAVWQWAGPALETRQSGGQCGMSPSCRPLYATWARTASMRQCADRAAACCSVALRLLAVVSGSSHPMPHPLTVVVRVGPDGLRGRHGHDLCRRRRPTVSRVHARDHAGPRPHTVATGVAAARPFAASCDTLSVWGGRCGAKLPRGTRPVLRPCHSA